MSECLGDFPVGGVVQLKWSTSLDGASITRSTDGTLRVYKGASLTQRASAAGITETEDFDGLTGIHHVAIDLADNTDASFYAAGSEYQVVMAGMVIGGATVNAVLAHFSIVRTLGAAGTLTAGERIAIADAILDRDMSLGTDSGSPSVRTVRQALRWLRNKWTVSGTTLTVYKEDDVTESHTGTVTGAVGADPVTGVDPA